MAKAAALGDATAHLLVARLYREGQGVEKDETKEVYHLEEAAIGGHPGARYDLALYHDLENEKLARAVMHWIIVSNLGCDHAMQRLKDCYKHGVIRKEDFAVALRVHHDAVVAMKSPQREAAVRAYEAGEM